MATQQRKVPMGAFRFPAAAVQFGAATQSAAGDRATIPVGITALSGEVVNSWYWGPCLHDLGGMQTHKPTLPLDYCHDDSEVLGFCGKFDIADGKLAVSATVVPFTDDDRASEVAYKAGKGVPYESSIFFDHRGAKIEELDAGQVATCNGKQVEGPLTIFRQWSLRGVAICPYGLDKNTASQFREGEEVSISIERSDSMSTNTAPAAGQQTADPPATPAAQPAAPATPPAAAGQQAATTAAAKPSQPADESVPAAAGQQAAQPTRKDEGKRFLEAFGDRGGRWFAEGLSFEEAQTKFTAELRAENEELKKRLGGAQFAGGTTNAAGAMSFGEEKPLSSEPAGNDPAAGKLAENQTRYGKGFGAFCTGIAMPKK